MSLMERRNYIMYDLKPKYPKLEARIAELGFNRTTLGERHGMVVRL